MQGGNNGNQTKDLQTQRRIRGKSEQKLPSCCQPWTIKSIITQEFAYRPEKQKGKKKSGSDCCDPCCRFPSFHRKNSHYEPLIIFFQRASKATLAGEVGSAIADEPFKTAGSKVVGGQMASGGRGVGWMVSLGKKLRCGSQAKEA